MANFTYIKAEVNIDAQFEKQFKDILGLEIDPETASKKDWMYALQHRSEYLPLGTNGSLEYNSETYENGKYAYFFIYGSLEDYSDDVIEWFIGRIAMLNIVAKKEAGVQEPVVRAVISADYDVFLKPYDQLQVWQLSTDQRSVENAEERQKLV